MTITSIRTRRLVTVVGVIAALLLGYGSIKAAAAWTAASAPLTVAPIPVAAIQDRLLVEQARSADLQTQLQALAAQSVEMTAALEAAQTRIATDTEHAKALAKELKDAKKKLAKLEASIAKAKRAAQRAGRRDEDEDRHDLVVQARTTKTMTSTRTTSTRATMTESRRPIHLAVLVGVSAGAYAISLAGVTALQSTTDARIAAERAPADHAVDVMAVGHDRLSRRSTTPCAHTGSPPTATPGSGASSRRWRHRSTTSARGSRRSPGPRMPSRGG